VAANANSCTAQAANWDPATLEKESLPNNNDKNEFVEQLKLLSRLDIGSIPTTTLPLLLAQGCRKPQETHLLWKTLSDSQARTSVWKNQLTSILPTRSQCDLLANFYIEHINWLFQSIHVPSFRREYAQFWDDQLQQQQGLHWLSLLFTILSVSALYVPLESLGVVGFPAESIRPLAQVWHNASQHALRAGDYESKPSIRQLQTFSITQLYWYATNRLEILNS
jgi:hypothetical protein